MRLIDLLKMGLRNLTRRKARTALTIIGVVIGTISIMVMISIGIGMNENFEKSILENGSMTQIYVSAYAYEVDEDGNWNESTQKLSDETVELLKSVEHVKCVTPIIYGNAMLYAGKYSTWANLRVMDMNCYQEFGYPALEDGTYPNEDTMANGLFVGPDALYEFGYYNGNSYKTKEVDFYNDKIELKFDGYMPSSKKEFSYVIENKYPISRLEEGYSESDYSIFMDIKLYKELFTKYAKTLKADDRKRALATLTNYDTIIINADNMNNVTDIQEDIEALGLKSQSDMQYIQPMKETANMLELVLGAIGGVAMLVSAINIANTMIMSIYERTREIGIMKVLGCKVSDIKKLFLLEAGMIGLIGGIIGVGLSYVASWAINTYGSDLFASLLEGNVSGESGFSSIPFWLPFFSAGFGILVGLISGFIPAVRATRISAIEAMKND